MSPVNLWYDGRIQQLFRLENIFTVEVYFFYLTHSNTITCKTSVSVLMNPIRIFAGTRGGVAPCFIPCLVR